MNLFLRLPVCHPLRDGQTPEPASVQGQVDMPPFMGVAKRDTGQLVTAEVHIYSRLVGGEGLEHRRSVRSICVWGRGDELSSNEIMIYRIMGNDGNVSAVVATPETPN